MHGLKSFDSKSTCHDGFCGKQKPDEQAIAVGYDIWNIAADDPGALKINTVHAFGQPDEFDYIFCNGLSLFLSLVVQYGYGD